MANSLQYFYRQKIGRPGRGLLLVAFSFISYLTTAQLSVSISVNEPSCYGYTDGTATADVSGGEAPYMYSWSNSQTGSMVFNVGAGTLSVIVTDANNEMSTATIVVNEPDSLEAIITPETSICDGSQGNYHGSAAGGTPPYIYLWSNNDRDSILEMPSAGFYMLTVNDANQCKALQPLIIRDPLQVTVVTVDIVCPMLCDGSAAADVSGGEGPFTFLWNTGDTVQILDWRPPGYYEVTVTDANGCTAVAGGTIFEPPPIVIDLTLDNGGNCDTVSFPVTATADPSGGTPPYSIYWANGETGNTAAFTQAGDYWVRVVDVHNCEEVRYFSIRATGGPQVTATAKNAGCSGEDDGSATANVLGGTPPYSYEWSNMETTQMITGLAIGDYSVTVTDANGCIDSDTVHVGGGGNIMVQVGVLNASCNDDDGQANAVAMGGIPPYTYAWNTGDTTQTIVDLPPGDYTVTVTDSVGCVGVGTGTVGRDNAFMVEITTISAVCGDSSGQATAVVTGGTLPFTYEWNDPNNQMTPTATGLFPGTYEVTVTDSTGCEVIATAMVSDSGSVVADFDYQILECRGDSILVAFEDQSTGNINSWSWVFGSGLASDEQNPQVVLGAADTVATLIVCSPEGCCDTVENGVEFSFIDVMLQAPTDTLCPGDTFSISVINNHPADSLIYSWSPDSLITGSSDSSQIEVTIPAPGMYWFYVSILNSIGCEYFDSVKVTIEEPVPAISPDSIDYVQCDSFLVDFFAHGFNPEDYTWYFGDPVNPDPGYRGPNPSYLYSGSGTYTLTLIPEESCVDTVFKEIEVFEPPTAAFDCEVDACSDTVEIRFFDRSSVPYNITLWQWTFSNGDTSNLQNPVIYLTETQTLSAQLIIEFGNGCRDTAIMDKEIEPFICYIDMEVTACAGVPTPLNPDGDTTYTYVWSPGDLLSDSTSHNPTAVLNSSTQFSVTISKNSCSKEVLVNVTVPPAIESEIIGDTIVCSDSLVTLVVQSPQAVMIEWSENISFDTIFSANDSISVMPGRPGTYYVRLKDSFDCIFIDSISVGNHSAEVTIQGPDIVCFGDSITLVAASGFPGDTLTYIWSPGGDTLPEIMVSPEDSMTYTVSVVNQFGCTDSDTTTILVSNLEPLVEIDATPDTIIAGESSQLTVTQLPGFTYQWQPESSLIPDGSIYNPVAVPDVSTVYSVTVTDSSQCSVVREVLVTVLNPLCQEPYIFIPNAFTPNDDGANDILYVRGYDFDQMFLAIYNRWGEKVFESTSQDDGWDGTYQGKTVDPDVYGYYLRIRCGDGEEFFKKGNITVLR